MKNTEYTQAVENQKYPTDLIVPLDKPFKDVRGIIQNLLLTPINSVALITSKEGSIRSNHKHEDHHYLYVISGEMLYYERTDDQTAADIKPILVKAGEIVFTAPNKIHKTEFLSDCVMMSFANGLRDHDNHEAKLTRVEF